MGVPRIPLSAPVLAGREREYLVRCIDDGWVASGGPFVGEFERGFAEAIGAPTAVSTSSGTAALHVALLAMGIGPGDEVIVPALTFVATANPVRVAGATPVLADVDPVTYTLTADAVEPLIGPRTRAIVPVHLFGHPADMTPLLALAERHGLVVIEDATEALGSYYRGTPCGMLGDVGCFSFNGNKVITAGAGGMLVARDPERLEHMRFLTLQARDPGHREYLHSEVGFNYALSNLHAALGLAQLERLGELVAGRRAVAARYAAAFADLEGARFCTEADWAETNFWLQSILVPEDVREPLMDHLEAHGVQARPFFHPLHRLAPYRDAAPAPLPVTEGLHARGVCIPSSADLAAADQEKIVALIAERLAFAG